MQKLVYFEGVDAYDIGIINTDYLDKGWTIKQVIAHDRKFIVLLEKETRKEKIRTFK